MAILMDCQRSLHLKTDWEERLCRSEGTDISCPVKMFLKKLVKNLMTFWVDTSRLRDSWPLSSRAHSVFLSNHSSLSLDALWERNKQMRQAGMVVDLLHQKEVNTNAFLGHWTVPWKCWWVRRERTCTRLIHIHIYTSIYETYTHVWYTHIHTQSRPYKQIPQRGLMKEWVFSQTLQIKRLLARSATLPVKRKQDGSVGRG